MRFCPFCSAETSEDLAVCQACGRRLPPLPPRRRNAPATGVQLPPRTNTASQAPLPRRTGTTLPPPVSTGLTPAPVITPIVTSTNAALTTTFAGMPTGPAPAPVSDQRPTTTYSAALDIPTAPLDALLPPTTTYPGIGGPVPSLASATARRDSVPPPQRRDSVPPPHGDARGSLLSALSPGPAAARREPPPPEPRAGDQAARRNSDQRVAPLPRPIAPEVPGSATVAAPPPLEALLAGTPLSVPAAPVAPLPAVSTAPMVAPSFSSGFGGSSEATGIAPPILPQPAPRPSKPLIVAATNPARASGITPPPTRTSRPGELADRPFTPPKVHAVPEVPEPGLFNAARYALRFSRARFQRRGAIKTLGAEIKQDTEALDQVLGALGKVARQAGVEGRVFSAENSAMTDAETRITGLTKELGEVDARKAEENSKFVDVERERTIKLSEAERLVDEAQKELANLEGQRRALRDNRKTLERRQKAYLKTAEDNERQAGAAQMGETRAELRRSAEQSRKEAATIEPERQECDRKLAALERPIGEATARLDAAKAELDAAKRSLADVREGHTHRLAELDAEQKRKSREIGLAEGEIARRLVTLGTLINLNRIDDPQFDELYQRIDRLRGAITSRTTEIEKLTAEREAYDRGTLVRGIAAMGGAVVAFIAIIVILRAIL